MTVLNRPIGIWLIAAFSLYSVLRTATGLFAILSISTVTYYNWEYFLFSGINIFLSIALIVTVLRLRKASMPIVITMGIVTLLGCAISMFQLTIEGGIGQGFLMSLAASAVSSLIILGVIWWYLSTLKKRGVLS